METSTITQASAEDFSSAAFWVRCRNFSEQSKENSLAKHLNRSRQGVPWAGSAMDGACRLYRQVQRREPITTVHTFQTYTNFYYSGPVPNTGFLYKMNNIDRC